MQGDGARRSLTIGLIREIRSGLHAELSLTQNHFGWLAKVARTSICILACGGTGKP